MKPPRGLPALVVRTPPQTPVSRLFSGSLISRLRLSRIPALPKFRLSQIRASPACGTAHTPSAKSPSDHRPLRLDPTGWGAGKR